MTQEENQQDSIAYQFINNQAELEQQVARWQEEAFLAIDTEFMRTNTYYAKPGLIQIADSKDVFIRCMDAVEVPDEYREELKTSYDEIIKSLHEDDVNAE